MKLEGRRELWKVTEWRDGAIFNTKSLGSDVWVELGLSVNQENTIAKELGGDFLGPISTSDKNSTLRSIHDDGQIYYVGGLD